jgi:hypothetical protein
MEFDKKSKTWYALAVLDKQRYLSSLEDELDNAWAQIKSSTMTLNHSLGRGKFYKQFKI